MAALEAQRLPRVVTAGAVAELVFDLYDAGAPARDLAGATATATLRRSGTPPSWWRILSSLTRPAVAPR